MAILKSLNLALRFCLELCLWGTLGYWGWAVGGALIVRLLLALVIVAVTVTLWGVLLSPRRPVELGGAARLALELLLFALAALALAATGHPALGAALAVVYVINKALIVAWKQG